MKVRNGFVSNSSSSSYVCTICSDEEVRWDRPEDWVSCVHDHLMCDSCFDTFRGGKDVEVQNIEGELISPECPICQWKEPCYKELGLYLNKLYPAITKELVLIEIKKVNKRRRVVRDDEYVEYVLKEKGTTVPDLLTELSKTFKDYTAFLQYILTTGV